MEQDGRTEIILGPADEVGRPDRPVFDALLDTPLRTVVVTTAENRSILQASVPSERTRLRIWTNHPAEPDEVIIGLG
jgi:hypothetical protein